MEKIINYLNKKYDKNLFKNTYIKEKKHKIEKEFKKFNLSLNDKNELDFFHNEVIYQGLKNKQIIEDAYFEGKVKMQDYYDTLDYEERVRLINYETSLVMNDLPYVEINGFMHYIPFFDDTMNDIYLKKMAKFDYKIYYRFVNEFNEIFNNNFDLKYYNSNFCSASLVYKNENQYVLKYDNCLYFVEDNKLVDHLTLSKDLNLEQINTICVNYYFNDDELFALTLKQFELLTDKDIKKIDKFIKKGKK